MIILCSFFPLNNFVVVAGSLWLELTCLSDKCNFVKDLFLNCDRVHNKRLKDRLMIHENLNDKKQEDACKFNF